MLFHFICRKRVSPLTTIQPATRLSLYRQRLCSRLTDVHKNPSINCCQGIFMTNFVYLFILFVLSDNKASRLVSQFLLGNGLTMLLLDVTSMFVLFGIWRYSVCKECLVSKMETWKVHLHSEGFPTFLDSQRVVLLFFQTRICKCTLNNSVLMLDNPFYLRKIAALWMFSSAKSS